MAFYKKFLTKKIFLIIFKSQKPKLKMCRRLYSREALCNENAEQVRRDLNAQHLRTVENRGDLFSRARRVLHGKKSRVKSVCAHFSQPRFGGYRLRRSLRRSIVETQLPISVMKHQFLLLLSFLKTDCLPKKREKREKQQMQFTFQM